MIDKRYYSKKKISSSKGMRTFQNAMGISMMIIGGLALSGSSSFEDILLCLSIAIGGVVLFVYGKKRKKLIDNFSQYVQYLEVQETVAISDLSIRMGRSEEKILKELGELLEKQYFVNMIIDYSVNQIKMNTKWEKENVHTQQNNDIKNENLETLDGEACEQDVEDEGFLRVQEDVNGDGKLKIYKDKIEYVHKQGEQKVTECYHYFNVTSITADTFMKLNCLKIKLVDDTEVSFFFSVHYSAEVYEELAVLLSELKENAPTMEELGISEEDVIKELKENKEKSKSEATKKIGKFISEYKNFKELNLFNKILHVAVPVLCLFLLLNFFGGGQGSKQDYIDCAKTVVSKQLRSPSTAMYYGEEILDEDKYGRVLVKVCVEAQNGFGGYVKNTFLLVITDYNDRTEEFIHGNAISYDVGEEWLEDGFIEQAKSASNWGEPLSDDEKL